AAVVAGAAATDDARRAVPSSATRAAPARAAAALASAVVAARQGRRRQPPEPESQGQVPRDDVVQEGRARRSGRRRRRPRHPAPPTAPSNHGRPGGRERLPVGDRYEDGAPQREDDRARWGPRPGGPRGTPAMNAQSVPGERMDESALVGEMKGTRARNLFLVVG